MYDNSVIKSFHFRDEQNISRIDDTCSPDAYLSATMIEVDKLLLFDYLNDNTERCLERAIKDDHKKQT